MKRTNISLKTWQYEYLKERAEREGESMSELIRQMISEAAQETHQNSGSDAIHDVVGMAESDEQTVSREHDKHIYTSETEENEEHT